MRSLCKCSLRGFSCVVFLFAIPDSYYINRCFINVHWSNTYTCRTIKQVGWQRVKTWKTEIVILNLTSIYSNMNKNAGSFFLYKIKNKKYKYKNYFSKSKAIMEIWIISLFSIFFPLPLQAIFWSVIVTSVLLIAKLIYRFCAILLSFVSFNFFK